MVEFVEIYALFGRTKQTKICGGRTKTDFKDRVLLSHWIKGLVVDFVQLCHTAWKIVRTSWSVEFSRVYYP